MRTANAAEDVVPTGKEETSSEVATDGATADTVWSGTASTPSDANTLRGDDTAEDPAPAQFAHPDTSPVVMPLQRVYRRADLSGISACLRPGEFQEPAYQAVLQTVIRTVLDAEAPILDKLLVDRVARAHGFKRSGRLIRERVLALARVHYHFRPDPYSKIGDFVWVSADDPARWNTFRVPGAGDEDFRAIDDIPVEEIAVAARNVLGDDLPIAIAHIFGVRRLTAPGRARLERVVQGLSPAGLR
ncbi:MAG TPA: DUF3320 domain-containing protein [Rhodanobacteraceae bacterium]